MRWSFFFGLLSAMAQGGNDQPGSYMAEHLHVKMAFKHINNSPALTLDQKAGLEFAFIEVEALASPWRSRHNEGIPNLERYVEAHPELFVHSIVWIYMRNDGMTDPVEFDLPSESRGHSRTRL
jgi:hypothetical protein